MLQITHFQYNFFENILLNEITKPQIQVFSRFLSKFFLTNYQIEWVQQDRSAYVHFPQTFDDTYLLPFFIHDKFEHQHYTISLDLHVPCFDAIFSMMI